VYALGVMMYEGLAGRLPFQADTYAQTIRTILEEEPVSPAAIRPGVPRDLETICLKCLRKKPQARYPTAKELADDLRRYLDGEPISARPRSRIEKAVWWGRRHPLRLGAWAAVVAVVVAAGLGARHACLHVWEHQEYFETFDNRWGLYEGVGALTPDQVRRREVSYRMTYKGRRGPCVRMESVDGGLQPAVDPRVSLWVMELLEEVPVHARPCRWDIAPSGLSETARDVEGGIVYRLDLRYRDDVPPAERRRHLKLRFHSEDEDVLRARNGVSSVSLVLGEDGRPRSATFLDSFGNPQPANGGTFGYAYEYYPNGMLHRLRNVGRDGATAPDDGGVATMEVVWRAPGRIGESLFFDADGAFLRKTVNAFDVVGNYVSSNTYADDLGRTPAVLTNAASLIQRRIDGRGRVTREESGGFDEAAPGFAKQVDVYPWDDGTRTCVLTSERFNGPGERVAVGGATRERRTLDKYGRTTTLVQQGFDSAKYTYDEEHITFSYPSLPSNVHSAESVYVKDGRRVADASGHDSKRMDFDTFDRLVRMEGRGYDPAKYGFASKVIGQEYDGATNRVLRRVTTWHDVAGAPVRAPLYSREEREFDGQGRTVKETTSGWDAAKSGHATQVKTVAYHGDGPVRRTETVAWLDDAGAPVLTPNGIRVESEFDGAGRTVLETRIGFDVGGVGYASTQTKLSYTGDDRRASERLTVYRDADGRESSLHDYSRELVRCDGMGRVAEKVDAGYDAARFGFAARRTRYEWDADRGCRRRPRRVLGHGRVGGRRRRGPQRPAEGQGGQERHGDRCRCSRHSPAPLKGPEPCGPPPAARRPPGSGAAGRARSAARRAPGSGRRRSPRPRRPAPARLRCGRPRRPGRPARPPPPGTCAPRRGRGRAAARATGAGGARPAT
jgi:hypothetical protein